METQDSLSSERGDGGIGTRCCPCELLLDEVDTYLQVGGL